MHLSTEMSKGHPHLVAQTARNTVVMCVKWKKIDLTPQLSSGQLDKCIASVGKAALKALLCKLQFTLHWKKLNYSKATLGRNLVM